MSPRVAVFVDGDNIGASHAPDILKIAKRLGTVEVARAYGDATRGSGWHDATGYRFVHSGTGKNATDLLLCIEAMEVVLVEVHRTVVIATSDGDFTHLALRLRERGITAVGVGEAKAPQTFRAACSVFECLEDPKPCAAPKPSLPCKAGAANAAPSDLDQRIREIIATNSKNGQGMRLVELAPQLHSKFGVRISSLPYKTWRAYFRERALLYDVDPKGPEAKIRYKPQGFKSVT
jgi:hypothetical protein